MVWDLLCAVGGNIFCWLGISSFWSNHRIDDMYFYFCNKCFSVLWSIWYTRLHCGLFCIKTCGVWIIRKPWFSRELKYHKFPWSLFCQSVFLSELIYLCLTQPKIKKCKLSVKSFSNRAGIHPKNKTTCSVCFSAIEIVAGNMRKFRQQNCNKMRRSWTSI